MEDVLTKPDQQPSKNQPEINKEMMEDVVKGMNDFLNSSQHIHQVCAT